MKKTPKTDEQTRLEQRLLRRLKGVSDALDRELDLLDPNLSKVAVKVDPNERYHYLKLVHTNLREVRGSIEYLDHLLNELEGRFKGDEDQE